MICTICSSELPVGNLLCLECGTTIDRVAQQVKASEAAMEIQPGAALCASVEGYIRLCEALPLPEVGAIVNEYLDRMLPQVQADGGQINWYSGEKIVAYFGFNDTLTSFPPAVYAVQSALRLHHTFAEFCGELLHGYARDLELDLRIGIASGELLRGSLGDAALQRPAWSRRASVEALPNRPRYRRIVIGDMMNLAMQLEYEARPGHIVTDAATYEATAEHFDFVSLGISNMRRRAGSVGVYSVIGPKVEVGANLSWSGTANSY